ncbi:MAG: SAM-dependent methyltransferase [Chloroflexi bacterium]|nr:SAM-dependent methyltransferase [Chloroflexota bacterium]
MRLGAGNEVFDALPAHVVQRTGGHLREVYVVERGGRLVEELGPLSRAALRAALAASGVAPAEGQRAEVCLAAPALVARLARVLRRGYVLAFDYGALDWAAFVAARPRGTLRTFAGHAPGGDPLARPGEIDVTYHVDFGALVRAAQAAGLAVAGVTTQRAFLTRLGWRAYLAALPGVAPATAYEANAYALRYLVREDGLGGFLVLGLAAGGAPPTLSGFRGAAEPQADLLARARAGTLPVPLLTPDHAPLLAARRPAALDFGELWADLTPAGDADEPAR